MAKARSLTLRRVTIPPQQRDRYYQQISERARHYAISDCRFWVFEDVEMPGVFIEFVEADDDVTLIAAQQAAPGQVVSQPSIYHKVEIPK